MENIVKYRAVWLWRNAALLMSMVILGAPIYFLWLKVHPLAVETIGYTFPANYTLMVLLALAYVPATYFLDISIPLVLRLVSLANSPLRVSLFVVSMETAAGRHGLEPALLSTLSDWAFTLPDSMLTNPIAQGKAVILAMSSSDKALRNWPALQTAYRATTAKPLPPVVDEPEKEDEDAPKAGLMFR